MGKGRENNKGGGPISQQFEKLQQVLQLGNANPGTTREKSHKERKKPAHNKSVHHKPVVEMERSKQRKLTRTMCQPISLAIAMNRPSQNFDWNFDRFWREDGQID